MSDTTSWSKFTLKVRRIEAALATAQASPNDLILVAGPPNDTSFAAIIAARNYGIGILPLTHNQLARSSELVMTSVTLELRGDDVIRTLVAPCAAEPSSRYPPGSGYIAYLSSGTTGVPKIVRQKRRERNMRGVAVMGKYGVGRDRGPHLMANPTFHLGTLGPALYALECGNAVVIPEQWDASSFAKLANDYALSSAFVSSDQLIEILKVEPDMPPSFLSLQHGGSYLARRLKEVAIDQFGDGLLEFYGTSVGVISEISGHDWLKHPGSVGRPYPGVRVRTTAGCAKGGLIIEHRPVGNAPREIEYPGDIGYVDEGGYVYIEGRQATSADALRIQNVLSEEIGIISAVQMSSNATLHFAMEVEPELLENSINAVQSRLQEEQVPVKVDLYNGRVFPRTESGKVSIVETNSSWSNRLVLEPIVRLKSPAAYS
ncbi:AMP-binding protein [Arthrobacter sp. AG258]|uniref:AMP-binding protein n=1 Tax=Arthrobacter sp. AG258 TaxID=2183899 RepID=UPI00105BE553|nr:AMP-binding protein [Arthrobacter sp. AG258]